MVTNSPWRGLLSSAARAHACAEQETAHDPIRVTIRAIQNSFITRIMSASLRCSRPSLQRFGVSFFLDWPDNDSPQPIVAGSSSIDAGSPLDPVSRLLG